MFEVVIAKYVLVIILSSITEVKDINLASR